MKRFKPLLRWAILGGCLFFVGQALRNNWQQVSSIRLEPAGWACLAIALGVTLLAHLWAGWVWARILREFRQPVNGIAMIQAYLKTNIAKYLPGNIWHYYGRITAATKAGASLEAATVSVLLEPLLMAAAALLMTLLCSQQIFAQYGLPILALQWLGLLGTLALVHPKVLNPVIQRLGKLKRQNAKLTGTIASNPIAAKSIALKPIGFKLRHYPLVPFWGELVFLLLRGMGFLLTVLAVHPITFGQLPLLLSAFSLAWLLGLVVPGAPGGIGVFEATAIALLHGTFSVVIVLSVVAFYRLISILAEVGGAGLAGLDQQR
jgi:hypothetical protein